MNKNHSNTNAPLKICLSVYKCSDCTEAFSRKEELSRHMRKIHKKIRSYHEFKCPNCEFSAAGKGSLTKHLQLDCIKGNKILMCSKILSLDLSKI